MYSYTLSERLRPCSESGLGGADGIRTHDLVRARDALSQLSHCPTPGVFLCSKAAHPTRKTCPCVCRLVNERRVLTGLFSPPRHSYECYPVPLCYTIYRRVSSYSFVGVTGDRVGLGYMSTSGACRCCCASRPWCRRVRRFRLRRSATRGGVSGSSGNRRLSSGV